MSVCPTIRSRTLIGILVTTVTVVLCLWIEFTHPANGDTAWFLYMAQQGLRGQQQFVNALKINPSYKLDPGHSYSFTVTATDTWGLTATACAPSAARR